MPRHLLIAASLILCLISSSLVVADVYKTVDKNGRITYTDVPPTNTKAKPVELKSLNSLPTPAFIPNYNTNETTTQDQAAYQVQIVAPENGTTLMADERSVTVSVNLNQNLADGYLLAYKVDSETVVITPETTYTIVEPPRGERTLTVEVLDSDGKSLAQSNAITLLVMRPRVKQKAVPVPDKEDNAPKKSIFNLM